MKPKVDVKDRSWATAIVPQAAFEVEYRKRFPWADVIPLREEYAASHADEMETLNLPGADDYDIDGGKTDHISESDAGKLAAEALAAGLYVCDHCHESFPNQKGKDTHMGMSHKGAKAA